VNDAHTIGLFDPPLPAPKPCVACGALTRIVLRWDTRADVPCCGRQACIDEIIGWDGGE
jgi:hypothetical protein